VRAIGLISLTLALGYLVVLGGSYLKGDFLTDRQRRPIANDFVNVVAARQLARGFLTSEVAAFGAAGALFPCVKTKVGLAAALIILALVVQRACCVATKSASH
jgi:hypothetical protein